MFATLCAVGVLKLGAWLHAFSFLLNCFVLILFYIWILKFNFVIVEQNKTKKLKKKKKKKKRGREREEEEGSFVDIFLIGSFVDMK